MEARALGQAGGCLRGSPRMPMLLRCYHPGLYPTIGLGPAVVGAGSGEGGGS